MDQNEEPVTTEVSNIDSSKYKAVDLSEFNISRTILISNEVPEKIGQTAMGTVEISVGEKYAIEVVPNPLSIAEKKMELESDLLYTIDYLEESENHIFFSKEIENSGIEPEYHFYLLMDSSNDQIAIKTQEILQLNKEKAEAILESFKKQQKVPA